MTRGNVVTCHGVGCQAVAAALGAFNVAVLYCAPINSTVLWNNAAVNWDAAAFTWN